MLLEYTNPFTFQDETAGYPIQEFIGLRSKLYSIKVDMPIKQKDGTYRWIDQKSACAGTKAKVADRMLRHEDYKEVLFGGDEVLVEQNSIRSYKHTVYTIRQTRISLSAIDTKRYMLLDLVSTRAIGHWLNQFDDDEILDSINWELECESDCETESSEME